MHYANVDIGHEQCMYCRGRPKHTYRIIPYSYWCPLLLCLSSIVALCTDLVFLLNSSIGLWLVEESSFVCTGFICNSLWREKLCICNKKESYNVQNRNDYNTIGRALNIKCCTKCNVRVCLSTLGVRITTFFLRNWCMQERRKSTLFIFLPNCTICTLTYNSACRQAATFANRNSHAPVFGQ